MKQKITTIKVSVILLGIFATLMTSCIKNEPNFTDQSQDFESSIIAEIEALAQTHSSRVAHRLAAEDKEDQEELQDQDKKKLDLWEIALKDAAGVVEGGATAMAATRMWQVALFGGLSTAIYRSVEDFVDQTEEHEKDDRPLPYVDAGHSEPIDLRNPISVITKTNEYIAGDFGAWHNNVIIHFLKDSTFRMAPRQEKIHFINSFLCHSMEDLPRYMQSDSLNQNELDGILAISDSVDLSSHLYGRIFLAFAKHITSVSDSQKEAFSNGVMAIVDRYYRRGYLPEFDAYCINAAISTYINSFFLWNPFVPSAELSSSFVVKCGGQANWIYVQDIVELYLLLQEYDTQFIGIPKVIGNRISEVFFYEDIQQIMAFYNISTDVYPNEHAEMTIVPYDPMCSIVFPVTNTYDPQYLLSYPKVFYYELHY